MLRFVVPLALGVALLVAPTSGATVVVPDAWAPRAGRPVVIPEPQSVRWLEGAFALTDQTRIVVGDDVQPEDLYAVRDLNTEVRLRTGRVLPVVKAGTVTAVRDVIVVGEAALNLWAGRLAEQESVRVTATDPGPEGYILKVMPAFILAAGSDQRGTYYAIQTLRQLLIPAAGRYVFAGAEIRDRPDHRIRAVHVLLDNASDELHVALIDRIFSKFKFNMLIVEAEYVRWDSAPNLWHPSGATKAQVARVVQAAREHHMEVVPLIQTLGHVEWLYQNNQNLDLLEIPPDQSNARFVYNPLNPRVYEVILPILDEAVQLFRPRLIHIGHDEVRNVVPFPYSDEAKRVGFGELFVGDTQKYYAFLKARGVGTMMWADVLLTNDFAPEVDRLPRDIVMVDWQYQEAARYPSLSRFVQWGFPVVGATWWKPTNIIRFAQEGRRQQALGMLRTTWTGQFQNRSVLERQYQQIYTYLTAADFFWKPDRPGDRTAFDASVRFREEWRPVARGTPVAGELVDLGAAATRSHIDDDGRGWIGKGREFDLRALRPGRHRLGQVLFEILDPAKNQGRSVVVLKGRREELAALPQTVRVPVGRKAAVVVFLHATPFGGGRFGEDVGAYTIRYQDGTQETVSLLYRQNIASWLDDVVSIDDEVGWSGRTGSGLDVRLGLLRWINPHPQKVIEALDLASRGTDMTPAIFAVTLLSEVP